MYVLVSDRTGERYMGFLTRTRQLLEPSDVALWIGAHSMAASDR